MRRGLLGSAVVIAGAIATSTVWHAEARARGAARHTIRALLETGEHMTEAGHYADADGMLRDALAMAERRLGPDDLDTARILNARGMVEKYTARFAEGHEDYMRALRIASRTPGADPMLLANVYHNLGGLEHARGNFATGEPYARKAVEVRAHA